MLVAHTHAATHHPCHLSDFRTFPVRKMEVCPACSLLLLWFISSIVFLQVQSGAWAFRHNWGVPTRGFPVNPTRVVTHRAWNKYDMLQLSAPKPENQEGFVVCGCMHMLCAPPNTTKLMKSLSMKCTRILVVLKPTKKVKIPRTEQRTPGVSRPPADFQHELLDGQIYKHPTGC